MYTLARIKDSMGIVHTQLDSQITADISVCLSDLKLCGIATEVTEDETTTAKDDPLIDKAVELYCKGAVDFQGAGQRYLLAYDSLKASMQMCEDYRS